MKLKQNWRSGCSPGYVPAARLPGGLILPRWFIQTLENIFYLLDLKDLVNFVRKNIRKSSLSLSGLWISLYYFPWGWCNCSEKGVQAKEDELSCKTDIVNYRSTQLLWISPIGQSLKAPAALVHMLDKTYWPTINKKKY